MNQFNSRISAARRNAEAMLNRSKKPDSTLKVEQEKLQKREEDAAKRKAARGDVEGDPTAESGKPPHHN